MADKKRKFDYPTLKNLRAEVENRGLEIPFSEETEILSEAMPIGSDKGPNRLVANPMEGNDADKDGGPSSLTVRRYRRLASGGSGVIWVEATSVAEEGRSNPRQLYLNERSAVGFRELIREIKNNARGPGGEPQEPYVVLQLTHSGRHSSPAGDHNPVIAHHAEFLDKKYETIKPDYPVISDGELEELKTKYVEAAELARECGFDAVDVKACHGYLIHELLGSFNRKNSHYGGEKFEDRTRFLLEVIKRIRKQSPELDVTTRLNIYDHIPYPAGFGMRKDGSLEMDLSEPARLIDDLTSLKVNTINMAICNPYYNPYVERPYDSPVPGGSLPEEHPLETIQRNIRVTKKISELQPQANFIGTGYSWLREYFPNLGAELCQVGTIEGVGVGRISLANPSYANQLLSEDELDRGKLCTTCSSCVQMIRNGVEVGCLTRDTEMYRASYRKTLA